jgi:hypothetical protein
VGGTSENVILCLKFDEKLYEVLDHNYTQEKRLNKKKSSPETSVKLLYILGAGRSGSTLLDLLLGSHAEIFSLGEIANLPAFLRLNWECGCGSKINECRFWTYILKNNFRNLLHFRSLTPQLSTRRKILYLLSSSKKTQNDIKHADVEKMIFQRILDKTNKTWLVDSSKDSNRLFYLRKFNLFEIKVIYLVRDGRGYVNSQKKPLRLKALFRKDPNPVPVWKSSMQWVKYNIISFYVTRLLLKREDWIMIRYEDLARDPVRELKKVCSFIKVQYDKDMLNFSKKINHNIGGNRMRFEKNQEIKLDEAWKHDLTNQEKMVFCLIGGIINRLLSGKHDI